MDSSALLIILAIFIVAVLYSSVGHGGASGYLAVMAILAAARLAWNLKAGTEVKMPPVWLSIVIGMLIGLLSGLVGVGGGIFLTPVLLLMNWSQTKIAAGVSAMFILVNSIAGIAGNYSQVIALQSSVWIWIAAAVVGGVVGSTLGANRFDSLMMRRVLAFVLLFAGIKLIFV